MTNTIYIHQPEKAVSFTRLPNFLFEAPTFTPLSNEAKVLYAFILRRTELSRKNGWADEYGRIFLYYPICEAVALLHCGRECRGLKKEIGKPGKADRLFRLMDINGVCHIVFCGRLEARFWGQTVFSYCLPLFFACKAL